MPANLQNFYLVEWFDASNYVMSDTC